MRVKGGDLGTLEGTSSCRNVSATNTKVSPVFKEPIQSHQIQFQKEKDDTEHPVLQN